MNSFYCNKEIVKQISEYQKNINIGYGDEYEKVYKLIEEQQDSFGYEQFMSKLSYFISPKINCYEW